MIFPSLTQSGGSFLLILSLLFNAPMHPTLNRWQLDQVAHDAGCIMGASIFLAADNQDRGMAVANSALRCFVGRKLLSHGLALAVRRRAIPFDGSLLFFP